MTPFLRLIAFVLGTGLVISTVFSAIQTFVLPRSAPDFLTSVVFVGLRRAFSLRLGRGRPYLEQDRIMALFAPVGLLALLPVWLALVTLGYTAMFWVVGVDTWYDAFRQSGSSLLTLGFAPLTDLPQTTLAFSEAAIGLILIALLIAYFPSIYAGFARREAIVTLLEVRAGNPPTALEMLS